VSGVTSQTFESYLPLYDMIPENWEDARAFLNEQLKRIGNAVNVREIGWFLDQETVNGQLFIPSATATQNDQYRTIFRKVISMGTLPNAGTISIPHGITFDANFTLVHLWAAATKPTAAFSAIPIPYASPTLNENIKINMDATNVNVTTAIDYTAYTRCYAIIEYILEP